MADKGSERNEHANAITVTAHMLPHSLAIVVESVVVVVVVVVVGG